MREIVFRGKKVKDGEWTSGSLWMNIGKPHIISSGNTVGYEVDINTVGQFTGMVDANDLMIYEGDILHIARFNEPYIGVVSFSGSCFISESYSSLTLMMEERVPLDHYDSSELTIVGTVRDNPEMLGGLV